MTWHPFVTVAAVIRDGDRYLVVEENPDGAPVLNQPAGHLEAEESLVEAVQREVMEETARHFTPSGLVGVYQWCVPKTDRSYLRFCFSGDVGARLPGKTTDPDIQATHWLTREQIASGERQPRSPLVLRCIDDARRTTPLDLDYLHALF